MDFRVLELFSGIGGMHCAFEWSGLSGGIKAAIDINPVANAVYSHNHVNTPVFNKNIQKLNPTQVGKLGVNMLLMSPPCQPHTRVGNRKDVADKRSDALSHLCTLLPQCHELQYILMENVKGFEISQARENLLEALEKASYYWREFLLSPSQLGVPNTRYRYYLLARKNKDFSFSGDGVWAHLPESFDHFASTEEEGQDLSTVASVLEPEECLPADIYLTDDVLTRRVWLLDIVNPESTNTMCFTKAYTHYSEGTGSILTLLNTEKVLAIFARLKALEKVCQDVGETPLVQSERLKLLRSLGLRYFTPKEVARLMNFPESFNFPANTTAKQKYRLLGNSINVKLVGKLLKVLCN